jgi:hypothetical protein
MKWQKYVILMLYFTMKETMSTAAMKRSLFNILREIHCLLSESVSHLEQLGGELWWVMQLSTIFQLYLLIIIRK